MYLVGVCVPGVCVYLVGVPESDGASQRQLSHQQVVHPAESKLEVLHLIPLEMTMDVLWSTHTLSQISQVCVCVLCV